MCDDAQEEYDVHDINVSPAAERDLKNIHDRDLLRRIDAKIQSLKSDPRQHGSDHLGGNGYSVRVGDYRILYAVFDDDRTVTIARIRHRREAYRT